jgi:diguanylate cyclase (GGDEF)-like protein/PAS domain S-box-containing protein
MAGSLSTQPELETTSFLGKTRWELGGGPASDGGSWEPHKRLLKGRQPFWDLIYQRTDTHGRIRSISVSGRPFFDAQGAFKGYRGVARDITERRRAEQLRDLEHAVNRCLADATSASQALKGAIRAVCESEGWEMGRYFRVDEAAGVLRYSEAWRVPGSSFEQLLEESRDISFARGEGLAGHVWRSGEPLWVQHVGRHPARTKVGRHVDLAHSAFLFPILSSGKVIGVISFSSPTIAEPDIRLTDAIRIIGSQIGQFVERKQAELDLRESEENFQGTMELAPIGIAHIGTDGRYLHANKWLCRLLGYTRDELQRLTIKDVSHPEDRDVTDDDRLKLRLGIVDSFRVEKRYLRKDGSVVWVGISSTAKRDPTGVPLYNIGIVEDISARKEAEERLRESEERFRGLTALSSDLFWQQDDQYRFTSFNGTLGGNTPHVRMEPIIGKRRWEYDYLNMKPSDWADHIADLEARRPFRELDLCRRDESGNIVWVSVSGEPVFDADGAFKGYRGVGREITERKENDERIRYMATHDALTTLPNRARFSETLNLALNNARRYQRHFAVMFIDLDRFKIINDTLGHGAGDSVLMQVGSRLNETVRTSDVVARLGGDEFVVLLQEVSERSQVSAVARKILAALVKPMTILGQECGITASIGICMYPGDAEDEQTLMKHADIAMYRAKEDGKNTFRFYARDSDAHSPDRLSMEASLRRGIEHGEFFLEYQPRLELASGRITGMEALLRWQHPELGLVPPVRFIPLAEETGLIAPIGKWVLRAACDYNVGLQRAGLPALCVSVNLSARQFADEALLEDIAAALDATGLEAHLLELELTESMVVQNAERARQVLSGIRRLGVRLAIDDFGVGYSSLATLKHFPIDTLKVDRAFISGIPQDKGDKALTEAIIAMGRSLSLTVVAEGVETAEQQAFLEEHDCHEIQGYHFSKPLPGEEFSDLLLRHLAGCMPAPAGGARPVAAGDTRNNA